MKQVIRGHRVSDDELKSIPEEERLYWTDELPHVPALKTMSEDEAAALSETIADQIDNVIYECPEGSDITLRVISSCASGPASKVYVECMHNTWARYACPA